MKNIVCLMLIVLFGCRDRNEVGPDSLFRTWILNTSGKPLMVEFRRNGTLLYETSKRDGGCCEAASFNATGRQIQFSSSTKPECALVYCGTTTLATGVDWRIEKLTEDELQLNTGNRTLVFRAY